MRTKTAATRTKNNDSNTAVQPEGDSTPTVDVARQPADLEQLKKTEEILRKFVVGDDLTADEQKYVDENILQKLDAPAELEERWNGDEPRLYKWEIPGERGYLLPIVIESAADAEEAREVALEYVVDTEDGEGRPLNAVEKQWIRSQAPLVVKDTTEITLNHAEALDANMRLRAQNTAYRAAQKIFKQNGIDVFNPQEWVDRKLSEATQLVTDADADRDLQHQKLANSLTKAIQALEAVREETGFAPPKPPAPVKPDYSVITVITNDPPAIARERFPDLAGANFLNHPLDTPLTDEEQEGYRLALGENGAVANWWRLSAGPREQEQVAAIMARIKAIFGEQR